MGISFPSSAQLEIVPEPISDTDIALLPGIHKLQVEIPTEMVGGPAFVKVFYIQPDGVEIEIGGCGSAGAGVFCHVLLREPAESRKLKVIVKHHSGSSSLESLVADYGDSQTWFSEKVAKNGDVIATFWNKAKIVVRIRATINPIWKPVEEAPIEPKVEEEPSELTARL